MHLILSSGAVMEYDEVHDLFLFDKAAAVETGGPLSICLRVNNRCPFKCNRCQSVTTAGSCRDYDLDAILQALARLAPLRIVWYGGETTLSPRLSEYIEWSLDKGLIHVVTTNMATGDPLSGLAGSFMYQVGIHGTCSQEFRNRTGWNLFDVVKRNFDQLFDRGHAVAAGIVITADWVAMLENFLHWLNGYPLRRLLISNSNEAGANPFGVHTLHGPEVVRMKRLVEDLAPQFPVIFPLTKQIEAEGTVIVEPVTDASAFAIINGEKIPDSDAFIQTLRRLGPHNLNRLTQTEYYLPV